MFVFSFVFRSPSLKTFSGVPNIRFQTSYLRDKLGRITQKTETVLGNSNTFDYLYYDSGYLKEVKKDGLVTATYTYDLNGNRENNGAVYDDQDRLTSTATATYTYTDNGEWLTKTEGADITQYKYDVLGNLLSVQLPDGNLIEYIIDGRNRRIGKKYGAPGATVLQKAWLYKDGLNPIAELDWDPVAEVWDLAARFVYASRANVPDYVIVPAGQTHAGTYRIISDHLGSPRLVVDITDGSIKQEIAYDEWGQETGLRDNPDFPNPFTFAGGLYDADTKLIRFGARDYDPEVGRWTTKDPIRFTGGDTNLFGYVFQDPINLIDIMGLDIWVEGSSGSEPLPHQGFSVGKPNGEYRTFSYGMDSNFGSVYEETEKGGKIEIYAKTTPEQDKEIIEQLIKDIPEDNKKWYGPNTCRNYSQDKFDKFQNKYHLQLSKPPVRKEPERDLLRSPWSSTTTVTGLSTSSATPSGSSK